MTFDEALESELAATAKRHTDNELYMVLLEVRNAVRAARARSRTDAAPAATIHAKDTVRCASGPAGAAALRCPFGGEHAEQSHLLACPVCTPPASDELL